MARKKEVKPVAATEVAPKAVRLDLDPDLHRQLRIEAAKLGEPMAVVVPPAGREVLGGVQAEGRWEVSTITQRESDQREATAKTETQRRPAYRLSVAKYEAMVASGGHEGRPVRAH